MVKLLLETYAVAADARFEKASESTVGATPKNVTEAREVLPLNASKPIVVTLSGIVKRAIANRGHGVTNCEGGERGVVVKCISSNCGHRVTNCDGGERGVAKKRVASNSGDRVGNC